MFKHSSKLLSKNYSYFQLKTLKLFICILKGLMQRVTSIFLSSIYIYNKVVFYCIFQCLNTANNYEIKNVLIFN